MDALQRLQQAAGVAEEEEADLAFGLAVVVEVPGSSAPVASLSFGSSALVCQQSVCAGL